MIIGSYFSRVYALETVLETQNILEETKTETIETETIETEIRETETLETEITVEGGETSKQVKELSEEALQYVTGYRKGWNQYKTINIKITTSLIFFNNFLFI